MDIFQVGVVIWLTFVVTILISFQFLYFRKSVTVFKGSVEITSFNAEEFRKRSEGNYIKIL